MANMEVIFMPQLKQRREQNEMVGAGRRRWNHQYLWYPVKQNEFYSEADRIYRETCEKYGDDLFLDFATERRLNERILLLTAGKNATDQTATDQMHSEKKYKCPN